MGNFSPVDRDEIQETKPKWGTYTCIVHGCRSFVNSSIFTYNANLHTPKVEIHTRQKLCYFSCYVAKAKLFCQKTFVPITRTGVFIWENFHPGYGNLVRNWTEISVTGPARLPIWTHRNVYQGKSGGGKITETEPSRLTRIIGRGLKSRN